MCPFEEGNEQAFNVQELLFLIQGQDGQDGIRIIQRVIIKCGDRVSRWVTTKNSGWLVDKEGNMSDETFMQGTHKKYVEVFCSRGMNDTSVWLRYSLCIKSQDCEFRKCRRIMECPGNVSLHVIILWICIAIMDECGKFNIVIKLFEKLCCCIIVRVILCIAGVRKFMNEPPFASLLHFRKIISVGVLLTLLLILVIEDCPGKTGNFYSTP